MPDITDERIVSFINSYSKSDSDFLAKIEKKAISDGVPIIRKEMASYLKVMLRMIRPERILEIGGGVGYSSILMSENTDENCNIITIENYEPRIKELRENLEALNAIKADVCEGAYTGRITLLAGDAMDILPTLDGKFDLIFMDAAKGQYINFLPYVLRLMKSTSVLISDNVLQEGEIVQSRYAVTRRNRTIYERMREYIKALTDTEELVTSIVPLGDGITISVMK